MQVRLHFAGWCFVWERTLWEELKGLDEDFRFWCADNATAKQLQGAGHGHALISSSIVEHIDGGSKTLSTLDATTNNAYTEGEVKKYNKKFGENIFGWGV